MSFEPLPAPSGPFHPPGRQVNARFDKRRGMATTAWKPRNRRRTFKSESNFFKNFKPKAICAMSSGGKRNGAGRKKGPSFRPATAAYRADAVQKMQTILDGADDPLSVVAAMVVNPDLDIPTRLSAASVCLPFLYPKLSASQIDARHTVTRVDSADLLRRLDERIARLTPPPPAEIEVDATLPAIDIAIVADKESEDREA